MTACSGKCGRPGAGPADSEGRWSPEEDKRHSWCDECWSDLVVYKRMPPGLAGDLPPGTLLPFRPAPLTVPDLSALPAARIEHKIVTGGEAKTVATITAGPGADTGSGGVTGYLAAFGRHFGRGQP